MIAIYIARDEDGTLHAFYRKPVREYNTDELEKSEQSEIIPETLIKKGGYWRCPASVYSYFNPEDLSQSMMSIDPLYYKELTWTDEPKIMLVLPQINKKETVYEEPVYYNLYNCGKSDGKDEYISEILEKFDIKPRCTNCKNFGIYPSCQAFMQNNCDDYKFDLENYIGTLINKTEK